MLLSQPRPLKPLLRWLPRPLRLPLALLTLPPVPLPLWWTPLPALLLPWPVLLRSLPTPLLPSKQATAHEKAASGRLFFVRSIGCAETQRNSLTSSLAILRAPSSTAGWPLSSSMATELEALLSAVSFNR